MARRRMIDPNIWESEDVASLTVEQRLLLIGLFSNADDYGKGRAKPAYVRSTVFPYDDIPVSEIAEDLQVIASFINIKLYEVDGQSYYKFLNWEKWQRVDKPQPSLIPEPIENDEESSSEYSSINVQYDSQNHSKNDSKNDSRTILEPVEGDSCLREEKRKEKKRKKENSAHAREADSESRNNPPLATYPVTSVSPSNFILGDLGKRYQEKIGIMSSVDEQAIAKWVEAGMSPSIVAEAIDRAASAGKKRSRYIEGILKNWYNDGHRDVSDLLTAERERDAKKKEQKGKEQSGGMSNAGAYRKVDPDAVKRWKEMHPEEYG